MYIIIGREILDRIREAIFQTRIIIELSFLYVYFFVKHWSIQTRITNNFCFLNKRISSLFVLFRLPRKYF